MPMRPRLPDTLAARVRAYAAARALPIATALAHLVEVGLTTIEARRKGASKTNARSKRERTASAREAVAARWSKRWAQEIQPYIQPFPPTREGLHAAVSSEPFQRRWPGAVARKDRIVWPNGAEVQIPLDDDAR